MYCCRIKIVLLCACVIVQRKNNWRGPSLVLQPVLLEAKTTPTQRTLSVPNFRLFLCVYIGRLEALLNPKVDWLFKDIL